MTTFLNPKTNTYSVSPQFYSTRQSGLEYYSEFSLAEFERTRIALSQLQSYPAGWNGNVDTPKSDSIDLAAKALLLFIQKMREYGYHWITPNITADEYGNVVVEWWKETRKITLYFIPDQPTEAIKVWGPDIDNQMEDTMLETANDFITLWKWLQTSK